MKNHKLFKVILLSFLFYVILTWLIPAGSYSGTTFTLGSTIPVGVFDIFKSILS
ncbi:MAG TPA: hypothetical protein GX747_00420, partial [Tenericutes bacterium]|nr:hypothetical protein [Mycoplasmatota bacterium]